MALPPSIPTSFVPHAAAAATRKFRSDDYTGAFGFLAYGVLGLVFILAIGIFFYDRILAGTKESKDAALKAIHVDPATVQAFVRLRNRLTSGESLLDKHPALSGFFSAMEKLLPTNVRFTALHISLNDAGVPKIDGAGVARSFNALAAASTAFATDGRIKDAIFSNISVNKDGSVSFALSATLDPKLVVFAPTTAGDTSATPSPQLP